MAACQVWTSWLGVWPRRWWFDGWLDAVMAMSLLFLVVFPRCSYCGTAIRFLTGSMQTIWSNGAIYSRRVPAILLRSSGSRRPICLVGPYLLGVVYVIKESCCRSRLNSLRRCPIRGKFPNRSSNRLVWRGKRATAAFVTTAAKRWQCVHRRVHRLATVATNQCYQRVAISLSFVKEMSV